MGKPKKTLEEEHENHERWLVSYADMITVLMILFIVLFAMSQVDQKKYEALKAGLAVGFGQSPSPLSGSNGAMDEPKASAAVAGPPLSIGMDMTEGEQEAVNRAEAAAAGRRRAAAEIEAARLMKVMDRLQAALRSRGLQDDVNTKITERGLVLSLVSRHVVFAANMPDLTPYGREVVDVLAPVLRDLPDKIAIDGHTNQVPVKPKYFPTDWELSSARAVNVLRYLNEHHKLPASRMTASAFGHTKPLVNPSKPGSQELNKRVDIVVLSALPDEVRAMLKEAVEKQAKELAAASQAASRSPATAQAATNQKTNSSAKAKASETEDRKKP